jgi:nucleoside-diphosphate-sugar epimerase
MTDRQRVLVTGAAGGLGRVMCRVLQQDGFHVKGLARPEDPIGSIPLPREEIVTGYVQDAATIASAMKNVDIVVHCAALLPNALHLNEQEFQDVNVEGPLTIMRQAIAQGLSRVIFFSTISVVDHIRGKITPTKLYDFIPDPHDAYLRSKINAERRLMDLSSSFRGHLAVIRPAFIYGPGNYAVWREPLELTLKGKMRLLDGGRALLPLIYAEDIGRYVVALLGQPVPNERYDLHILSNPQRTTMGDVFGVIASHLGVAHPGSIPSLPMRAVANMLQPLPLWIRLGRLKLLTPARVQQYSQGYDLSGVLTRPLLMQMQMTDYREGLARMLDDFTRGKVEAAS